MRDVTVVKAELGATNAIPGRWIVVSALTVVDGNHGTEIAMQKAAIAHPGKPFILGYQRHEKVREAVERAIHAVGRDALPPPDVGMKLGMNSMRKCPTICWIVSRAR